MANEPMIRFKCQACGAKASVRTANAGNYVKCPLCGAVQAAFQVSPKQGDIVYLAVPGKPVIWISANLETHSELNRLSAARHEDGVQQLMLADLVLVAFANTKAMVVEPGFPTHRVRILEGKHAGREGIVSVEEAFTQPTKRG